MIIESGCNVEGLVIAGDRIYIYGNNNIVSNREVVHKIVDEEGSSSGGGGGRNVKDYIDLLSDRGVIISH